jgi:hypothetical protein
VPHLITLLFLFFLGLMVSCVMIAVDDAETPVPGPPPQSGGFAPPPR